MCLPGPSGHCSRLAWEGSGTACCIPSAWGIQARHVKAALERRKLPFLQPFKEVGREGKNGYCSCPSLPSICGQNRFPVRMAGWLSPQLAFSLIQLCSVTGLTPVFSCCRGQCTWCFLSIGACYRGCWIPMLSWSLTEAAWLTRSW